MMSEPEWNVDEEIIGSKWKLNDSAAERWSDKFSELKKSHKNSN